MKRTTWESMILRESMILLKSLQAMWVRMSEAEQRRDAAFRKAFQQAGGILPRVPGKERT